MQRLYVPERGRESMTGMGVPTATHALPSGAGRPPPKSRRVIRLYAAAGARTFRRAASRPSPLRPEPASP